MLALLLLASSCKRISNRTTADHLIVDEFEFGYLSAKAKITFEDGKKDISGIANIRMAQDSLIWISITPGMGIEAARILISEDSVFFMDRINKNYLKLGFAAISKKYQFDMNFQMIQSLLLGNLIMPYSKESLNKESAGYSYSQKQKDIIISNFIGMDSRKLERFAITDTRTDNSISVNYDNFEPVASEFLPYDIKAVVDYKQSATPRMTISIGYNKAEIEDKALKFPFAIPDKYNSL